ncbi:MAG: hypothetical protein ACI4TK_05525, partial [Agathobacter sp.]
RKTNLWKKGVSCMLAAGLALSMTACGGKKDSKTEPGVANTDTSQTEFDIMGWTEKMATWQQKNIWNMQKILPDSL